MPYKDGRSPWARWDIERADSVASRRLVHWARQRDADGECRSGRDDSLHARWERAHGSVDIVCEPLSIATTSTLKMRAFRTDWTPSAVVTQSYTITPDTTALTAMTRVVPQPNDNGWNNTNVTVMFFCVDLGVTICPEPVTVTQEGPGPSPTDICLELCVSTFWASGLTRRM